MKNIAKFISIAAAATVALASCEDLPDYNTYKEAADNLIYSAVAGTENIASTKIAHTPVGSFGSFTVTFPAQCNSGSHVATSVKAEYSADAAQAYINQKGLKASVLPSGSLQIDNATLTLPENERYSADSLTLTLTGDFTALTERTYIAAVRLSSDDISTSEDLGTYYLEVDTEVNLIRPIESKDDMVGFLCTDKTGWTAEGDFNNIANLVDGNSSTYASPTSQTPSLTVDMQENHYVTGLAVGGYGSSWGSYNPEVSSIEYSTDGTTWEQAGTPDYYVTGSVNGNVGTTLVSFYGYVEARYVKFNLKYPYSYTSYMRTYEFSIYEVESTEPTLYIDAENGTGTLLHAPGESSSSVDATFNVKSAPQGSTALTGTVAVDNSLVEAYNTANGTLYAEIPVANIAITGADFTIAGGETTSSDINVKLTGDLTGLKNGTGYLIPIKVSSSANVSESKNVYYIVVTTKEVVFKTNPSLNDMGTQVTDKSGWSISWNSQVYGYGGSTSNVIDGDYTTAYGIYDYSYEKTTFTVNFGSSQNISGINLVVSDLSSWNPAGNGSLEVQFSADGTNWVSVANPSYDDNNLKCDTTDGRYHVYCSLYETKAAQYLKVSYGSYYCNINELDIYTK